MTSNPALQAAEKNCRAVGLKLTSGRKDVLEALLLGNRPLGAYDVLEALRQRRDGAAVHPQTVYRALDFLVDAGLVHRIASTGQFLPCDHIKCQHAHQPSQFLLCQKCSGVTELALSEEQLAYFQDQQSKIGFVALPNGVEIRGICRDCA